jgi:hypothetical protein
MSALTYEIKDPRSPVSLWLRTTFPHHKEVQSAYRLAAGPARVVPGPGVALGTQGAAIDWWLRFLIDPAPSLDLAAAGLMARRDLPCLPVGLHLLEDLGVLQDSTMVPMDPTRFASRPDEWWASVSYALAMLVELFRAPSIDGSRLMRLGPRSSTADLMAMANDNEVADLIAMRDLAQDHLLTALPAGPVATGMTFEGSRDLNADADLIAGGTLVDFKASQGGAPRKDGTRAAKLGRDEIDQLLGYTLMDYLDEYHLDTVAIYATRYGYLARWPIADLGAQLAGHPIDLPALRQEFAQILRVDLPAYWKQRQGFSSVS